eukprot:scaffold119278_cov33-Tisochrysis_lutea.AAC.2
MDHAPLFDARPCSAASAESRGAPSAWDRGGGGPSSGAMRVGGWGCDSSPVCVASSATKWTSGRGGGILRTKAAAAAPNSAMSEAVEHARRYGYLSNGPPLRTVSQVAGRARKEPTRGPSPNASEKTKPRSEKARGRSGTGVTSEMAAAATATLPLSMPEADLASSAVGRVGARPRQTVVTASASCPKMRTGRRP